MDDSVVFPISLKVTDVDVDVDIANDIQKPLNKQLKEVTKSMNDILSKTDMSKVGKSVNGALNQIETGLKRVTKAYKEFDESVEKAGKSSDEYKKKLEELEKAQRHLDVVGRVKRAHEKNGEFDYTNATKSTKANYDKVVADYEATLKRVKQLQEEARPENFAGSGDAKNIEEMQAAYSKLLVEINKYNNTLESRKYSDEYEKDLEALDKLIAKIDKLQEKSDELTATGASDRAKSSLQYKIEKTSAEMNALLNKMQGEIANGSAFRFNPAASDADVIRITQEYEEWGRVIEDLEEKIQNLGAQIQDPDVLGAQAEGLKDSIQDWKDYLTVLNDARTAQNGVVREARSNLRKQITPEGKEAANAEYERQKQILAEIDAKIQKVNQYIQEETTEYNEVNTAAEQLRITNEAIADEMRRLTEELSRAKAEYASLGQAGNVASGAATAQAQAQAYEDLAHNSESAKSKLGTLAETMKKTSSNGSKLSSVLNKVSSIFKKIGQGVVTVTKKLGSFIKGLFKAKSATKSTTNSMSDNFKKLLKNFMMFGLGFRTVYYLIKRLRSLFVEQFESMAEAIPEVNASIKSFKLALANLKGAIGTAFQPIVSAVIPALNQLIAKLTEAMQVIGRFFASLTGQGYIYEYVAGGIETTGEAAEKAKRSLMGFDEINRLDDDTDSGSGAGGAGQWVKKPLEEMSKLAELIKEAWEKADFTEVGQYIGEKLKDACLRAIDYLDTKGMAFGERLGKSLATFINGFTSVEDLAKSMGEVIASALNVAIHTLNTFFKETDWAALGTFIKEGIIGALRKINVKEIGETLYHVIKGAIDFLYALSDGLGPELQEFGNKIGSMISDVFSRLLETELIDGEEVTGAQKLGRAIFNLAHGIMIAFRDAIKKVDWAEVGKAIGQMINEINIGQLLLDFTSLVWEILKALAEAIVNVAKENPIATAIALAIILGINAAKAVILIKIAEFGKEIAKKLFDEFISKLAAAMSGAGAAAAPAAKALGDVGTAAEAAGTAAGGIGASGIISITGALSACAFMAIESFKAVDDWKQSILDSVSTASEATAKIGELEAQLAQLKIEEQQLAQSGADLTMNWEQQSNVRDVISKLQQKAKELSAAEEAAVDAVTESVSTNTESLDENAAAHEEDANAISEAWNTTVEQLNTDFQSIDEAVEALKTNLDTASTDITTKFETMATSVSTTLETMSTTITTSLQNLMVTIQTSFDTQITPTITTCLTTLVTQITTTFTSVETAFTAHNTLLTTSTMTTWQTIVTQIQTSTQTISTTVTSVMNTVNSTWTTMWSTMQATNASMTSAILSTTQSSMNSMQSVIISVMSSTASAWQSSWATMMSMLQSTLSGMLSAVSSAMASIQAMCSSIVSTANNMASSVEAAANRAIAALRRISAARAAVGSYSVPYLANGAVIPPNKEFMAVLGDQKHGTNIEAPLETIQEAVALVMDEQLEALAAMAEAIVNAINNKDMSVVIGDKDIGQAANRFNRRQNLVKGL